MSINNLSIRSKIAIPLLVIVAVFSAVTILNVIKSNQQAAINHELNNVVQPVLENLEDGYRDIYKGSQSEGPISRAASLRGGCPTGSAAATAGLS